MEIGRHISISEGLNTAILDADAEDLQICQVFISNPRSLKIKRRTTDVLYKARDLSIKHNIKTVIHASYVINLCHPHDSNQFKESYEALKASIEDAYEMGAIGSVVHMGKSLKYPKNEAINNYIKGIKKVLENTNGGTIILETAAGQGTEICYKLDDLAALYNAFTDEEKKRIKICIDTCHIFASGYDITKQSVIDEINNLFTRDSIALIHLNDSEKDCNCKVDRHADITAGKIKDFNLFVNAFKDIPMILETNAKHYSYEIQMAHVRKLIEYPL